MGAPFTKTVRGVSVPTIGIGVFEVDPGETEETIADAIAAGYRHVDTAAAYGNEEEVGRGIARSGVDRDEQLPARMLEELRAEAPISATGRTPERQRRLREKKEKAKS